MKCRMNVSDLAPEEKAQLVQAFLDLKNPDISPSRIPAAADMVTAGGGRPNRYDDYVWLHNTVGGGAHQGPAFGPWHREYLHQLEHDLQQVSGVPGLTVPYWDWTTARTSADAGWPFTRDFMGGFGNAVEEPGTGNPSPTAGFVSAGPFSDPAVWPMNIRMAGDDGRTLRRSPGVPSGEDLPTRAAAREGLGLDIPVGRARPWPSVYDREPWHERVDGDMEVTIDELLVSFRKYLEYFLHNGVHVWIGGVWGRGPREAGHMSRAPVAVNDPSFWLHHCNVDRLWAIWQRMRRDSVPPQSRDHQPQGNGTADAGHNGQDVMINFSAQDWFSTRVHARANDVQDHQLLDHWYRTDMPTIALETPALFFRAEPAPRTVSLPVRFTVSTCQRVRIEVVDVEGENFSVPAGQGVVVVDHDHHSDVVTAEVRLEYQATGVPDTPQVGAALIVASITDTDGYDTASPGDSLTVGTWTVDFEGTPAPGEDAAEHEAQDRMTVPMDEISGHRADDHGHGPGGEPVTPGGGDAAHGGHHSPVGTPHHPVHDHSAMVFTAFRRDASGRIVEVTPADIERDTSRYDEAGHDPSTGPDFAPPAPGDDHGHGR